MGGGGSGQGGGGVGLGGSGWMGTEKWSLCENSKKKYWGGGVGSGWVGQGWCEWRSEAFVKIKKK